MKLLLLATLLGLAFASEQKLPAGLDPLSDEMINAINDLQTSWQAGRNFHSSEMKRVKGMLGVKKNGRKLQTLVHEVPNDLPATFDSRTQWPKCKTIGQIRDQGNCGSCWAFGAVEAMSDRFCVASNGKQADVQISAQDLVTCADLGGCDGGDPGSAWESWVQAGLVTGGLYGSKVGCQPYTLKPCRKHAPCTNFLPTPKCSNTCEAGYKKAYKADKRFGTKAYNIANDVKQIQTEIFTNGPVEADFTVYADFVNYKSGVYIQKSQDFLGGHAVKILGWGTEGGVDYWLVANSWNTLWGDKGYFKIRRGTDECGIEDDINAGTPKL